jgi:NAD(P)-dependent dehydrogenase (short-subunit alcohol dehydrogenase family)
MLKGKVIVITGGAGLLGKEFATAILENHGIAIIADSDTERGLKAESGLKKLFPRGRVDFQPLNITDKESITSAISMIEIKYKRIDALVNNAYPRNKNFGRKFEEVDYEDFCESLNINLGGYFLTSQLFLNFFCTQGMGNIINISSIYGLIAPRFEIYNKTSMTMPVEYAVIKSALIHLTKYMAKYYKGRNIRVNAISPGGIFDNQPSEFLESYRKYALNKGMLDKSDISGTLVYLLSDLSHSVNGQNLVVDDGFTL